MTLPKRVSNYAWCKTFEQKKCICKGKCSSVCCNCGGVRACLARAEPVLICSYQKYLSTKYCTMVYLSNKDWSRRGSYTLTVRYDFCKYILARTVDDDLPAEFISSDEANFNINSTVNLYHIISYHIIYPCLSNRKSSCHYRSGKRFAKSERIFLSFRRWSFMVPAPSLGKKPLLATFTLICLSYGFCPPRSGF